MDSLTQIVLGSTVTALAVPSRHRRKALAVGAALGTLPDLDVIPLTLLTDDPVTNMVMHRGASHSLFVLFFVGLLLWLVLRRYWYPVRDAPLPWLWAIQLGLLTHPLLDSLTVYGTQLFWPLATPPVMWASVWIIDPAYTLPLLAAVIAAAILGPAEGARRWLKAAAVLSSFYLLWSLTAKVLVDHAADAALRTQNLHEAPRFSVPMPLNTLLWQVVVMTPEGYAIGYRSLIADRKPMRFTHYPSDTAALASARRTVPALQRLLWFNQGFMKATVDERGMLVVSDLRMGQEPDYVFQFTVAKRVGGEWRPVAPQRVVALLDVIETLPKLWERIWHEPAAATGHHPASWTPQASPS
ncbi:MAG TPA: metal-dependent hydrolase [Candidimonas sp.]|nr:metal-dependent hydrolase [Candidimonas sp.]